MSQVKTRLFAGLVLSSLLLQGCVLDNVFGKRAKRETLVSADQELDILIAAQADECSSFRDRLLKLKEKVAHEIDSLK